MDQFKTFTVNSSLYAVPFYKRLGFLEGAFENHLGVDYVTMTMNVMGS
ncbi:MAG: GNAT family N-acetyltransferase [Proteobacteria bacterium]|nr:MAG: GNAT family N-acetyltransferase [Pseudomonadota bacterium]